MMIGYARKLIVGKQSLRFVYFIILTIEVSYTSLRSLRRPGLTSETFRLTRKCSSSLVLDKIEDDHDRPHQPAHPLLPQEHPHRIVVLLPEDANG